MPAWRDRECKSCKKIEYTASKSEDCAECFQAKKKNADVASELERIEAWGYEYLDGPTYNNFNKRVYKLRTPCEHEWTVVFSNLIKQTKNAEEKGNPPPCGLCGGKLRMKKALVGYVAAHGKDYDVKKANHYTQLVRKLTEHTYRENIDELNPNRLTRGLNHGHHLDHIVPIIECFKKGWTPEQAAAKENLKLIPFQDNLSKGAKLE
jgi:hypothetical protein